MKKPFTVTMILLLVLTGIVPAVQPVFTQRASAYAPPPPPMSTPTSTPPPGQGAPAQETHIPPSPNNLPPEVEQARARQAVEAVLEKYLRYWGPRYQVAPVEVAVEGNWAHGVAEWQSQAKTLKEPIHILAHRLPDGAWQALMPGSDGLYLQWLGAMPDSLVAASEKSQLRTQVVEADALRRPVATPAVPPAVPPMLPDKEQPSVPTSPIPGSAQPTATPTPILNQAVEVYVLKHTPAVPPAATPVPRGVTTTLAELPALGIQSCSGGMSASQIDGYLQCKKPNSQLIGYGATFMSAGQTYNVDPRFVVAISAAESSFGTNGSCATQYHNAWGYGGGWPSCRNFATWEQAINQVTYDIGTYYLPKGQNTIESFVKSPAGTCTSHCWCASACTNWVSTVKQVYEEQGGNRNTTDLTYYGNGGTPSTPVPTSPPPTPQPTSSPETTIELVDVSSHTVTPGQKFTAHVTVRVISGQLCAKGYCNNREGGDHLHATPESSDNTFGAWPVQPVIGVVNPGGTFTFQFDMTAPGTEGSYTSVWQMRVGGNHIGPQARIAIQAKSSTTPTPPPSQPPSAPALIRPSSGSGFNEGQDIVLEWSATGNEYQVKVYGGPADTQTFWQSGTTRNIGPQPAGYSYAWQVQAKNAAGLLSGWSELWRFVVKPAAPSNLSAQSVSCNATNLSWHNNSSNVQGYRIYRNGSFVKEVTPATATSYQDTVSGNTTYSYYVIAFQTSIQSDASNTVQLTSPPCVVPRPDPPVLLSPSYQAKFDETLSSITFSWSGQGDTFKVEVTGYETVSSGPISGNQWTTSTLCPSCSTPLPVSSYLWYVIAHNSGGDSERSNIGLFTIRPAAPSQLTAQVLACNRIRLTWQNNSRVADRYYLYQSDQLYNVTIWINGQTTTWYEGNVSGNTTYKYKVTAVYGLESLPSNEVTVTTPPCQPPLPDLHPYAPPGYPFPVVPSSIQGTHEVNTLYAGQPTYFDWHFINDNGPAAAIFYVELWVDSTRYVRFPFFNFGAGWIGGFDDWAVTISTPGWHTVRLVTDPNNTIAESNEINNTWEHQFYWTSSGDSYEPDNTSDQAKWIYNGLPQTHSIVPATDVDWVKFSLDAESNVVIETSGPSGNTRMWLYDSNLNELDYDDDDGNGLFSKINCVCGTDPLSAGTYYVKIDEYGNDDPIDRYDIALTTSPCAALQPDLHPYARSGYPYPVVPSSIQGTHEVDTLYAGQTTYFDWFFANSGNATASGNFYVELWVDSTRYVRYPFSDFGAGWVGGSDDWAETISTPGWHTVRLVTDPDNAIAESDETNNVWERQFYWVLSAPYSDNMENGPNDWTASGLWHQIDSSSPYPASHSGTHSWWYGQDATGNYDTGSANSGDLTSPHIYIPSTGYYLRFWYMYETETQGLDWDQRWVQISVDDESFNNILQFSDEPMNWWLQSLVIDLSGYAGHTIQVRFHFDTLDAYNNGYRGWYIDDFDISTTQPPSCTDTHEPNNTTGQATAIAYGQTINADICPGGDYDFYIFTGMAGDKVVVDINAQVNGSALDSYIFLLDSDGTSILAENDDEIPGDSDMLDSKLGYQLPHDGMYYIKVRAWNHPFVGGANYPYNVRLFTDTGTPMATITSPANDSYLDPTLTTILVSADDNESGVNRVEFLWHSADWQNSDWIWLGTDNYRRDGWSWDFDTSGLAEQQGGAFYIFTLDWADNWAGAASWNLGIDRTPPTVTVNTFHLYGDAPFIDFWVDWWDTSNDLSGIDYYDVQYRDGVGGVWTDLLTGTSDTYYCFVGQDDHTYYFRARARDWAGNESTYAGGDGDAQYTVQICPTPPDAYEADNTGSTACGITTNGIAQTHTFHAEGDQDWVKFHAAAAFNYVLATTNTGGHADTVLYLYDTDGSTLIDSNDDYPGIGLSSRLSWQPAANGVYYAKVDHWDPYAYGCTTAYGLSIWICDVDVADIQQVASRWRTSCANPNPDNNPDTPNYEAWYDIDGDCDIDIVDIMLVVKHWGETCG